VEPFGDLVFQNLGGMAMFLLDSQVGHVKDETELSLLPNLQGVKQTGLRNVVVDNQPRPVGCVGIVAAVTLDHVLPISSLSSSGGPCGGTACPERSRRDKVGYGRSFFSSLFTNHVIMLGES
jgi:hypothetical protein